MLNCFLFLLFNTAQYFVDKYKNALLSKYCFSFIFRNRGSPNTLLESDATKNSPKTKPIPVIIYIWLNIKITDCQ